MPNTQPNPLAYIEQLLDDKQFQEAESLLLEQLERKQNLAAVYNALGIIAIEHYQDYKLAEQNYRLAIDYNDTSATIHFNLAILYDNPIFPNHILLHLLVLLLLSTRPSSK